MWSCRPLTHGEDGKMADRNQNSEPPPRKWATGSENPCRRPRRDNIMTEEKSVVGGRNEKQFLSPILILYKK